MRELRIIHPDDFPDVPDCDGSCAARGAPPPCVLHAGLCCPDDPLEIIMVHPDIFNEELMEEVVAALQQPGWAELPLPPATTTAGGGKEVSVVVDEDASGGVGCHRADRGGNCSDGCGAPWPAMSSDSSWTASSSLETESPPPPPQPAAVSRLIVPRKKRDMSVKRGKRLWSLGIPNIPASRSNPKKSGGGRDQDDRQRKKVGGGDDGGRQRLPVARPPMSKQTQRACTHCDSTETPQWRAGPAGPGTLCNACGIRYTMNKLLPEYRPSTSPSFKSDKHSNRHRKVVKLREKKVKVEMMIDNMAPAPDRGDFEKKVKVEMMIDNMAPAPDHGDFMDVCKYI
ncbi:unnamed protein product [Urochloa humidicola]